MTANPASFYPSKRAVPELTPAVTDDEIYTLMLETENEMLQTEIARLMIAVQYTATRQNIKMICAPATVNDTLELLAEMSTPNNWPADLGDVSLAIATGE